MKLVQFFKPSTKILRIQNLIQKQRFYNTNKLNEEKIDKIKVELKKEKENKTEEEEVKVKTVEELRKEAAEAEEMIKKQAEMDKITKKLLFKALRSTVIVVVCLVVGAVLYTMGKGKEKKFFASLFDSFKKSDKNETQVDSKSQQLINEMKEGAYPINEKGEMEYDDENEKK
eukprot:gene9941-2262_t